MTTSAPTISDLEKHLQAACNLELWTIPLYLTAAYSITNAPNISAPQAELDSDPKTIILSVVVQEMYHLQLACNLASAYGFAPQLNAPTYDALPYIHPESQPPTVQLGNAIDVIGLMVEVETPDPGTPPTTPQYDANGNPSYDSIGDLYNVLKILAGQFPLATSPVQNVQSTFGARYQVNKVDGYDTSGDANTVVNSVHVIGDQGEGQIGQPQELLDHDQYTEPVSGSRFYAEDHISHYYRFELIQNFIQQNPGALTVYTTGTYDPTNPAQKTAQGNLNVVYTKLLRDLRLGWQTSNSLSLDAMWFIRTALTNVLALEITPEFQELTTLTDAELDAAYNNSMDDLDPCYTTRTLQDPNIDYNQPGYLHACQGLNECASKGAPLPNDPNKVATGTQPGDGYCATVAPHTCQGGNACNHQGGCGYSPYLPGANTGKKGSGGCETPVSPWQVFDTSGDSNAPSGIDGVSVWAVARLLLMARLGLDSLPAVKDNPRRMCVNPSIQNTDQARNWEQECEKVQGQCSEKS